MSQNLPAVLERARWLDFELELALRSRGETLALLETLQSHAPVGFGFVNLEFRLIRVNEALAAINGMTVAEQLGQPVAAVLPELWPQLEPLCHQVLDSGQSVCDVEIDAATPADPSRMHHWLLSLYPVVVDGEVIGIGVVVVDITERTDAEDARRRLARIVEDSGDAIFSADLDGIATTWNAAAERLFGYTAAEMIGQLVGVLAPAGVVAEQEQMRFRMHAGGATERVETIRRRKDGSLVDVLVTASPSTDRTGAVIGVLVMMQNITENRGVLRDLHASRRRLAEAQRIAEIGSFELDLVTGVLTWSAEHYRILGLDPTLAPNPALFLPLVHPDDLPTLARAWKQATGQGVGFDLHYRIIRPDGEQRWVHGRSVPEVADDGSTVRLAGTLSDTTEQVEVTRERREAQARFETSFEQAGIGAAITTLDGVPTRVNAALCTILGRPREQLVHVRWDDLFHPGDAPLGAEIRRRVATGRDDYQDERRFLRPDGSTVWCSLHTTVVRNESGQPEYCLAQLQDITERRQMQDDLVHHALHDTLTGLANGALLTDRLTQALAQARRHDARLGVIFFDLDQFKMVNDSFGHGVGDALISQVAIRVSATIRASDTIARFGGDEFVILCDDNSVQDTERTAERVLAAIREPFHIGDRELNVTASAGIAIADESSTPDSLLRDSDHAMYIAKSLGRDRVEMFDEGLRARAERRLNTTTALRHALDRNELSVHYQPVIDLATGAMVSTEALLRWNHPGRPGQAPRQISPAEFIPIAEESGLIIPIGAWVLEQACQQLAIWQRLEPSMSVAVNLSVVQVLAPDLLEQIEAVLDRTQISPQSLNLELTESVFMHDTDHFGKVLTGLKNLGVQLSLDDFGTGYSSLSYLSRFPFDAVKIDQAFIRGLGINPHDTALVAAILSMADALGLSVTAEGIEDQSQLDLLKNMHCQRGQGYHLGRPMPDDALSKLLAQPHR